MRFSFLTFSNIAKKHFFNLCLFLYSCYSYRFCVWIYVFLLFCYFFFKLFLFCYQFFRLFLYYLKFCIFFFVLFLTRVSACQNSQFSYLILHCICWLLFSAINFLRLTLYCFRSGIMLFMFKNWVQMFTHYGFYIGNLFTCCEKIFFPVRKYMQSTHNEEIKKEWHRSVLWWLPIIIH